jgi:hypothetical protein
MYVYKVLYQADIHLALYNTTIRTSLWEMEYSVEITYRLTNYDCGHLKF